MRSKFKKALLGILISWSFLQLTNQSWDQNCLIMLYFEFWSHDRFVSHKYNHDIEILKSIIRQFRPHENCRDQEIKSNIRNFDLMIKNLTYWKSWILISWNLTSWPWVLYTHMISECKALSDVFIPFPNVNFA